MTKWNDKENMSVSFRVEPNEEAKAFFERMQKELTEREEAFKKRIKQLFDEEIGVGGDKADEAYKQILQVFTIGYQHRWNDLYSLHKAKESNRPMMTHDGNSRFFSEEDVKKTFQLPDWPAGTEVVCYCRSTNSRDTIEQIAQRGGWKIVKYVHIDELPIAKFYKPGLVMFAKREVVEWKREPTMPSYKEWRNQMLGGLRPSDWDKHIKIT